MQYPEGNARLGGPSARTVTRPQDSGNPLQLSASTFQEAEHSGRDECHHPERHDDVLGTAEQAEYNHEYADDHDARL